MLKRHVIRWRYDGGNIPGHELFMMFVDGLVEVAQHHRMARCTTVDAVDPSGTAVFYTASNSEAAQASELRWYQVATTISALALDGLVPARRIAEVEFKLLVRGVACNA